MHKRSRSGTTSLILGYLFLYLPILFLVIFPFNESRFPDVWTSFSLTWYKSLFQKIDLIQAMCNSLKIASMSAFLSVILGTLSAVLIERYKINKIWLNTLKLPLIMPEVINGLSLLLLFIASQRLFDFPSERGMFTIVIGHTTVAFSYVTLVIQSRLRGIDKTLEEAALDLGARHITVFLKIVLPIIFPALVGAWFLAFALSLDDVIIASFLSGPGATTLPVLIFSSLRLGITPEINALATIIVGILSIVMIAMGVWIFKRSKKMPL